MVKGLYTAYTGMIEEQRRLDVITNNLANASTTGYKKEGAVNQSFADQLAIKIKDTSDVTARALGDVNLGVKVGETYTDYSQGNFRVTDNTTDFAINGDGFFAIEFTDKSGVSSVKYTRDGAFTVNTEGYLVTKDGDYVLNANGAANGTGGAGSYIRVNPNLPFTVDDFGTIVQNEQQVGTIGVTDFQNYNYLSKYGENLYDLVDGGQRINADCSIEQGVLEASNVNTVSEMVNMITITRAYEANQKIIQTIDQSLELAANTVGRV